MKGIVRAAVAAVASLGLVSMAPVVTAASAPAPGVHKSAAAFKVSAAIDKTEVVAGEDTVTITGRVRPKAAGEKVYLQQRRDGSNRWVKSGKATIKQSGRFVLKGGPSANHAGVRFYRVLKPASDGLKAATSRELLQLRRVGLVRPDRLVQRGRPLRGAPGRLHPVRRGAGATTASCRRRRARLATSSTPWARRSAASAGPTR